MQLQVTTEDIVEQYKRRISELNDELVMERVRNAKLNELIEQQDREGPVPGRRGLQEPRERLPGIPAPPPPPVPGSRSDRKA